MKILLPEKVNMIIHTIQAAGFEAYAVGGCVRDSILGRVPDDWDITTSAKPEDIKKLFKRTIDTGIEHGTVTVMLEAKGFEVTTYRIDGEYEDSRHPKEVTFTSNLREDLRRRDFTINAMAYNDEVGLVDIFEGISDIEKKIIRCVGDAKERFTEDALRMMRAVRFSAQLGYSIDEGTKEAIKELAPTLQKISAERVQVELVKLVTSNNPDYLKIAFETGITAIVLPEFDLCMETEQKNPHHMYSVGEHTLWSMKYVERDKVLRLAMLFHDMGKPKAITTDDKGIHHFHGHNELSSQITREVLRRLRFDNDTIHKVERLVYFHDYRPALTDKSVRRFVAKIGKDLFPLYILVQTADVKAQSDYKKEEKLHNIETVNNIFLGILEREECLCLKDLAVTGKDLIDLGIKPGKEIGEILNHLLEMVLENPGLNEKEILLNNLPRK
ncbi:MAG: CCA tRNA nucleotidyltransferase [Lachnospiraceae bacterium]|nr:CCA tRNA nucleotidyltransferase [Lachnospiraceae bacterium]